MIDSRMSERTFKLMIDVPFLKKGKYFKMDDLTGEVYLFDGKHKAEYPLRPALASYLWLLCTEKKYMKRQVF